MKPRNIGGPDRRTALIYFFKRIWYRLTFADLRRRVRRTMVDPRFGEMRFSGTRSLRDDMLSGAWWMTPPGFAKHVVVFFPRAMPTPDDLVRLEALLGDLDGLFERSRSEVAAKYEEWVEEPMPADWRAAFTLNSVDVADPEDADAPWQVVWWCENAQHFFQVDFEGEKVAYVEIEG